MNGIIFSLEALVCSETYKVGNRKPPWTEHILQKVFGFLNEFLSSGSLLHLYFKNSKPKAALLLQVDSSFITDCSKIMWTLCLGSRHRWSDRTQKIYIFFNLHYIFYGLYSNLCIWGCFIGFFRYAWLD